MATAMHNIVNTDKKLTFGGNVKENDQLDHIMLVVQSLLEQLFKNTNLNDIDLASYGIACKPDDASGILSQLFAAILKNEAMIAESNQQTHKFLQAVQKLVEGIESFKVKVTKDSTQTQFLIDAFADTFSHLKVVNDKVQIVGLVPIGTHAFISKDRLKDFDNQGKGKTGTDLVGWYIRNGQPGTDNALNKYIKTIDTTASAGVKKGTNKYKVTLDNIISFTRGITGALSEVFPQRVNFNVNLTKAQIKAGTSAARDVLVPGLNGSETFPTDFQNFKHSHSHNLKFVHDNQNPRDIEIDLEHVKEIPIVFLGF
jgi:hypothetical protein